MAWPDAELLVDEALVRDLIAAQFPELGSLPLRKAGEGFDNFLWRVGERHVARFPRRALAVEPLRNELRWLDARQRRAPVEGALIVAQAVSALIAPGHFFSRTASVRARGVTWRRRACI